MSTPDWTLDRAPRLDGRNIVVTGANSGIGFEAARAFARLGARVVFACRSADKSEEAMARIRAETPAAQLEHLPVDLASLASVREFAAALRGRLPRLDALVNNAGVMALPLRRTADGFEMQLGTNHLAHFALTGLLFDLLAASAPARVVTVSSSVHKMGRVDFDDLNWERGYSKWPAYMRSKLANLLFTFELARRLEARGLGGSDGISGVRALACHPGYAATNLQHNGPRMAGSTFGGWMMSVGNRLFAQDAAGGALPTIYATVADEVRSGDYIGPSSVGELHGAPRKVKAAPRAHDQATAQRLWSVSEELTGVRFLD